MLALEAVFHLQHHLSTRGNLKLLPLLEAVSRGLLLAGSGIFLMQLLVEGLVRFQAESRRQRQVEQSFLGVHPLAPQEDEEFVGADGAPLVRVVGVEHLLEAVLVQLDTHLVHQHLEFLPVQLSTAVYIY